MNDFIIVGYLVFEPEVEADKEVKKLVEKLEQTATVLLTKRDSNTYQFAQVAWGSKIGPEETLSFFEEMAYAFKELVVSVHFIGVPDWMLQIRHGDIISKISTLPCGSLQIEGGEDALQFLWKRDQKRL